MQSKKYINDLCEKLHEILKIQEEDFNIEKIVTSLGGKISHDNIVKDAKISRKSDDKNGFLITLSGDVAKTRERFSIAHELGHLFLHMEYLNKKKWEENSVPDTEYFRFGHSLEEREANEFAAAFLMPKSKFMKAVDELTDTNGRVSLSGIARKFGVSEEAANIRGFNLGVWEL